MPKQDWAWMPHPGHFICARWCRFHLNTWVGNHIVSTVGEYVPPEARRLNEVGEAEWIEKNGYHEIGYQRTYETLVFPAKYSDEINSCCPYRMADASEIDSRCYNSAEDAYKGHLEMCEKWSDVPLMVNQGE